MNVLTGRLRRESVVIDSASVRKYSWQFCGTYLSDSCCRDTGDITTYTAEEVSDEHYKNTARDIRPRVQALESMCPAIPVQHDVILSLLQILARG
jgi:hypothetical protein